MVTVSSLGVINLLFVSELVWVLHTRIVRTIASRIHITGDWHKGHGKEGTHSAGDLGDISTQEEKMPFHSQTRMSDISDLALTLFELGETVAFN